MVTSSQVVNAYGARPELTRGGRARWDYEEESPLRDARGFTYSGALYDPAEALADEDLGLANVILTNGARLYVDHAHPEYSTPEVHQPAATWCCWDKAGERVMAEASRRAATVPGTQPIHLYKNNTDNKGASYGAHENYLMRRQTPFADIVTHLTPFFVTRQIVCGAGRVGIGPGRLAARLPDLPAGRLLRGRGRAGDHAQAADHQHPRRAARRRRQVPAAARHHRRRQPVRDLDLPQGGHDLAGAGDDRGQGAHRRPRHRRPGAELKAVSHDPSLQHLIRLRDGRRLTALDLQWAYLERARSFVDDRTAPTSTSRPPTCWTAGRACSTGSAATRCCCAGELDWVAKLRLLEGYRERESLGWALAQAAAGRPAVLRRPAGEGPLPPARRPRLDEAAAHRRGGPARR